MIRTFYVLLTLKIYVDRCERWDGDGWDWIGYLRVCGARGVGAENLRMVSLGGKKGGGGGSILVLLIYLVGGFFFFFEVNHI